MRQTTELPDNDRLVRKCEAASFLACSLRTIDRLVVLGELNRIYVLGAVRYRLSEIQAIIQRKTS